MTLDIKPNFLYNFFLIKFLRKKLMNKDIKIL